MEPIGGSGSSNKVVAAWDSFKRYFSRTDGVSSGGESGDSDACSESGNETPKREYFEKANSLFSGVNLPFKQSSSSYNKVSTNEEDGVSQRLRWGKASIPPEPIRFLEPKLAN